MAKKVDLLSTECDEHEFKRIFTRQCQEAKALVLVIAPFLTEKAIDYFLPLFEALIRRGRRVCVKVQEPWDWKRRNDPSLRPEKRKELKEFAENIARLEKGGVHVTVVPKVHTKVIVIDDCIVWRGSQNVLSHRDTRESMTMFNSRAEVARAIGRHRLDQCQACLKNPSFTLFAANLPSIPERIESMWKSITRKRNELHLSRVELASRAQLSESCFSRTAGGHRNLKVNVLIRICDVVGLAVMVVPRYMVPSVSELLSHESDIDSFD
jgi:hypothetical protein